MRSSYSYRGYTDKHVVNKETPKVSQCMGINFYSKSTCAKGITQQVYDYSMKVFNEPLCKSCQAVAERKKANGN